LEALMAEVSQAFPRAAHHGIQNHLLTMQDYWAKQAPKVQMFVDRFQLFLLSLLQENAPLSVKAHSNSQDAQLYRSIVRMLSNHLQDWITAEQIATTLCYSPSRIKRTFAKYSDIGIHKYLLKLKTAEAIRLLRQGESCSEVSRKLGFGNQNYFSTVFKRETGLPPSNYTEIENGSVK
jgi:AraC-like DNA-binding protein